MKKRRTKEIPSIFVSSPAIQGGTGISKWCLLPRCVVEGGDGSIQDDCR